MTNPIYVDHGKIETAAANLLAHKSTFDEVLGQLESDLAPMISSWSGEARDLYLQKKAAWDKAARDISDLLGHIAKLTDDAFTTYANTVFGLVETWTST